MFEGIVRQLILRYLGRYIKDLQKEQLKINFWNGEVLLENVELTFEAFDYLQLPFALKQGRLGRLSIKIPWKKLGWVPFIITIEDVFVSTCQRDDLEWSADAFKRKEFSGIQAKLAKPESDEENENQAGKSFTSYIAAKVLKILDYIQVTIRNVHVVYHDVLTNMVPTVIGLRFSSLSITKQNLPGFSTGIMRGGHASKVGEIQGLEMYCSTCQETLDLMTVTNAVNSKFRSYAKCEEKNNLYLLAPVDVSISLMVNRSGSNRSNGPQYFIKVELTELVMSLSEFQLEQLLILRDYLCIWELRKKYGRYRPWDKPLSRKCKGWQVVWWHYAQQSVLSDVRRRLKKNSWKYSGQQLNCRRKYVSLYKIKLKNLRDEQDIYEATEFKPVFSPDGLSSVNDDAFFAEIKILVYKVSTTLSIRDCDRASARIIMEELVVDFNLWEEPLVMTSSVNNVRIINEGNGQNILLIGKAAFEKDALRNDRPSVSIQVESSSASQEVKLLVEVLQPLEVTYDSEFGRNIMNFYHVLETFNSHHERVMLSLNEFEDVRARLFWKAKYILSSCQRVVWDVCFGTININILSRKAVPESSELVLQIGSFHLASTRPGSNSDLDDEFKIIENMNSFISPSDSSSKIKPRDLYDHFEIQVADLEMKVLSPYHDGAVSVLEKMSASMSLTSCIIPDESVLLKLRVNISIQLLRACFSPSIYLVGLNLLANENWMYLELDSETLPNASILAIKPLRTTIQKPVSCMVASNMQSISLRIDLENDNEHDCTLLLNLEEVDIRYELGELEECSVSSRALKIITYSEDSDKDSLVLCSSRNPFSSWYANQQDTDVDCTNDIGTCNGGSTYSRSCILVHYEKCKNVDRTPHKYGISLADVDFHCYPCIIRLLVEFSDKIEELAASSTVENSSSESPTPVNCFDFRNFGFSNFSKSGSAECTSVLVENFPFTTIESVSSLGKEDNSFVHPISEWRKQLKLRESQIRCPELKTRKLRRLQVSHSESGPQRALSNNSCSTDLLIDLNSSRMSVHFHDSSSIIGTISLTTSKSFLSSCRESLDMLFSIEGLSLHSCWWSRNNEETLWGPSSKDISPIVNIRVIKYKDGPLRSHCKIRFSFQHVSCMLLPEFLAVIIGYISLSDWYTEKNNPETENSTMVSYIFEILDSTITTSTEESDSMLLKLVIPHLYGSVILDSYLHKVLKDIPPECSVAADKIAKINHCLNLYARDLSLSLLLSNQDECDTSLVGRKSGYVYKAFIAPFSADLYILMPVDSGSPSVNSSASTCVMVRVHNCQLITKGDYIFCGLEALLKIIDQFSFVGIESTFFRTDLTQFRIFRKSMKAIGIVVSETSVVLVNTRCCVDLLSVQFHHLISDSISSYEVARTDMKFEFSASFRNEITEFLNVSFRTLALYSNISSVVLAECNSDSPTSSVLDIELSISDEGENELLISLLSLDIWLHLLDWTAVIKLLMSYNELAKTLFEGNSTVKSSLNPVDQTENGILNAVDRSFTSPSKVNCFLPGKTLLIVKSECLGIKLCIPVSDSRELFSSLGDPHLQGENSYSDFCEPEKRVSYNFMAISLQSRCSQLIVTSYNSRIKFNFGKVNGTLGYKGKSLGGSSSTLPCFQFSEVNIESQILSNQPDRLHILAGVQCDSLDLCLSYQIFYFLKCMSFRSPDSGRVQFTLSSFDLTIKFKKISALLTDGRRSKAPLLEALVRDFTFISLLSGKKLDCSVAGDLQVNYNNIHKVLWEPFLEPCKFQVTISWLQGESALFNSAAKTDIHLNSTEQLNLNVTESFIEAIFRATEMVKDALGVLDLKALSGGQGSLNSQICEYVHTERYAPYILQNLTSLPLALCVCQGPLCPGQRNDSVLKDGIFVNPGDAYPIYINVTPEEQLPCDRPSYSSEKLDDKQLPGVAHNYIIIQFDGTAAPSTPISMDRVGPSYFEVDFSKSSYKSEVHDVVDSSKSKRAVNENNQTRSRSGFIVPVVCYVSVQRYCKLLQFYSTVILLNGTSVPIEVGFDIPFGLSPKIFDPVLRGQEFPLPLHLAEAGRVRWRPLGKDVLWSEAHNLSNILSSGSRSGLLRSFVCYPSHLNSDPFRCCIAVQEMCFPPSVELCDQLSYHDDGPKKYIVHQVVLSSPLVVRNFLPDALSVTLDSGGVTRTALLSEVQYFYHVDSLHDLDIAFSFPGFGTSVSKFPRIETFRETAKFTGTKFCQTETLTFNPDFGHGPLYVSVEKTMDAFSEARDVCVYVPFLLYNCTAFPLFLSDSTNGEKGHNLLIPSCYNSGEKDLHMGVKDGLGILSSNPSNSLRSPPKSFDISRKMSYSVSGEIFRKPITNGICKKTKESFSVGDLSSKTKSNIGSSDCEVESKKLQACMYAPDPNSPMTEIMVRVRRCMPGGFAENIPNSCWSSPFFLVQPTGSTTVSVPQLSTNAAVVISVTSRSVAGQFSRKIRIITFQPRYVISNACSKELYCKQKGTDSSLHLGVGQHSHLQWPDTLRELLLSIRFDEPGWQWSGCFLPDNLGDTQVKMRNYVSGAVTMIRVEVQNADVLIRDEKIVGSFYGNSGTNLIILSDDDTGFMPYRIDNFSTEKLRVYQQSCEFFETIIHAYTSCPYAWDEPCCPHRLTVEVPGQCILGSYTLDYLEDYMPVKLSSRAEKPERTLLVSVHAEGAVKVLSIIDLSYHVLNDAKDAHISRFGEKRKHDPNEEASDDFNEKISICISCIGISLMNSYPQELIFACAKKTKIDLLQSQDKQKFSLQIECLQIDNQLQSTQYPVILSFNTEHRSRVMGQIISRADSKNMKNGTLMRNTSDRFSNADLCLSAEKWRNKDASLVSFKSISLRLADFHLQLDQEIILRLLEFYRATLSRSQMGAPLTSGMGFKNKHAAFSDGQGFVQSNEQYHLSDKPQIFLNCKSGHLQPSIVPIGAPWQQIYLLARRQKKVYIEMFYLSPIKLTLSFLSTPWMHKNVLLVSGKSIIHRGLLALADVEGAEIHLGQLNVTHMGSWDSIQEIIISHYSRQLLQEMYKVFGSAGVIGNPMGFARSVSLGIKDFVSAPAKNILKSPAALITGMAQGTSSLLGNTVYALSNVATQFSRAAHKGIVAFTFDDLAVAEMGKQQKGISLHNKGVVDEFLEGLTSLLQSPIKGAEKHGLLGVLSGVAMGMTGLVTRPAASILDATGKTAQSIRNRSKLYRVSPHHLRVRLPRTLSRQLPLRSYSLEEAVGTTYLSDAHDGKYKDEVLLLCKMLKQGGKLVIVTQRLLLVTKSLSLVDLGKPQFQEVPDDPLEAEIVFDSLIHADTSEGCVHIVSTKSDPLLRQNHNSRVGSGIRGSRQLCNFSNTTSSLPLYQTDLEFTCQEDADYFLQFLLSAVEEGKKHGKGRMYLIHQSNCK